MHYRKDIDGLRAVAVIAVVLFHAKVPGFSGGFVGVDVFFVISGFLITGLIAQDVGEGRFSFAEFYHRRIRRIVPALLVVYVASTILAALVMLPGDMAEFGRSLLSSALFVSNVFFFSQAGYFDGPSELKPLLHTWSLSIEEQFYVVWPLLLLAVVRWRRQWLLAFAVAIGLLSAAAFVGLLHTHRDAVFFLTPFRAWELMLGAALALRQPQRPLGATAAQIAAAGGLLLIAVASTAVDAAHPLAVLAAIPACIGAALLIRAGIGNESAVATRLLATRPAVAIGFVSYSLYLWHWPLLVFARYSLDRALLWSETALLLAASLVAAFLSYRLVELPARRIDRSRMRLVIGTGVACLGAFALFGQQISRFGGLTFNLDPEIRRLDAATRTENIFRRNCYGAGKAFGNDDACTFGRPRTGGSYDMVIFGDSHANHFTPTMSVLAEKAGLSGRQVTAGGCLALLDYHAILSPFAAESNCRLLREAILRFVEENPRLRIVVLSHRWSVYLGTPFSLDGRDPPFLVLGSKDDARSVQRSREAVRQSLDRTLEFLENRGIKVLLLGEVPPLHVDPVRCMAGAIKRHEGPERCARPVEEARRVLADADALLREANARHEGTIYVSPLDAMCAGGRCAAVIDGVYMYRDYNHLNRTGAEHLARSLRLPGVQAR